MCYNNPFSRFPIHFRFTRLTVSRRIFQSGKYSNIFKITEQATERIGSVENQMCSHDIKIRILDSIDDAGPILVPDVYTTNYIADFVSLETPCILMSNLGSPSEHI